MVLSKPRCPKVLGESRELESSCVCTRREAFSAGSFGAVMRGASGVGPASARTWRPFGHVTAFGGSALSRPSDLEIKVRARRTMRAEQFITFRSELLFVQAGKPPA